MLNIVQLSLKFIHNIDVLKAFNTKVTRCSYTRWVSRRPSAIVNEDEIFENDDTQETVDETRTRVPRKRKGQESKNNIKKVEVTKPTEENSIYTSLKEDDRLISSLMVAIKSRKRREKNNTILLEGLRLIQDALQAGVIPKAIFFSRLSDVLPLSLFKDAKLYKVPYRTIQLWSNLTTSPGLLGIFETPNVENKQLPNDAIPLTIICDNIREPGNLGTIIRTAAAVGCEKLLLMKGCVDLWEPKVLRGAVGAHFRLPIFTSLSWDQIPTFISNESEILLADNNVTYETKLNDSVVNLESNIDTSIEIDYSNTKEKISEIPINDDSKDNKINELINKSSKPTAKTRLLVKQLISQLPVVPYYTLDYTRKEVVLVIGGETDGVSLQSCELLRVRNCTRVNVPLTNGVDSLNTSIAASIVAFEVKKQFLTRKLDDK